MAHRPASTAAGLDTADRAVLAALADVWVPPVRPPRGQERDPHGFWALRGGATHAPRLVAELLPEVVHADELPDLRRLLAVLRRAGLGRLPRPAATALLVGLGRADARAGEALAGLRQLLLFALYGGADEGGGNPTWAQLEFPGPPPVTDTTPRLAVHRPRGDEPVLDADVVVVGSGAGGGVVAATAAAAGLDVVVLEAGGDHQPPDFPGDEASALRRLYWRAGLATTDEGNVALLAGSTLGGGSTVNWSNCVRPPDHVRAAWAAAGLDGLDTAAFDAHLDVVAERMGVTDEATRHNAENQRLREGAEALGWSWATTARNVDPHVEDHHATGTTGWGDRSGAKQGSLRAWLPDAVAAGARVVTSCRADRVLLHRGRASGVTATLTRSDGTRTTLLVRARRVVLACGALETPALLLRSGLGGPAVGRHLRLHPVPAVAGIYDEPQRAWWGPPQGLIVDERVAVAEGHGYLIETPHWSPGLVAAAFAWAAPRDHRAVLGRFAHMSTFLALTRERGGGTVRLDQRGEAVVRYPLDDPLDRHLLAEAVRDLVRLHVAADARAIADVAPGRDVWRRGDDPAAFADRIAAKPLGAAGRGLFSAHQMGSARAGDDPGTSVADPDGQLHDAPGVWVGDTSAFPTAVGANPMLTCMALAHRTATRLLAT